jgi:hypothetical protein
MTNIYTGTCRYMYMYILCVYVYIYINARILDYPTFGQSSTGMKQTNDARTGSGLSRRSPADTGMPMSA